MFGKRITLFKLFGFPIRIEMSWLIIAVLITWSLAAGYFPQSYKNLSQAAYWIMGVIGALGLFMCIILHELGHSLVARHYGLKMKGIVLFIFGGVSEMPDEPAEPKVEFLMALSGPAVSGAIAAVSYAASLPAWPVPVKALLSFLWQFNAVLLVFNLVPAFPLDGGRVLRAVLWRQKNDMLWATNITSQIGSAFGFFMVCMGVLSLIAGNVIGAVWWFLLGMFLSNAAKMSYQQLLWRQMLSKTKVEHLMNPEPKTVPPEISTEEFVENYVYRYHFNMFPAMRNGEIVGCVSTEEVKKVPREQWATHPVEELLRPCSLENTIGPDESAQEALKKMTGSGVTRLLVMQENRLVGIITLKDMRGYIAQRMELEGDGRNTF